MAETKRDMTHVFLSTIDDIDFAKISKERYVSLLKDEGRRRKVSALRSEGEQKRSIVSGLLMQYCFRQWLEKTGQKEPEKIICDVNAYGKPVIRGYESFGFSISHGGRYVACAVGTQPVGVDVQERTVGKNVLRLAKRYFTQREYEQLAGLQEDAEQITFFTRLWTMKESYMKYIGQGLSYGMNGFYAEDFLPLQKDTGHLVHRIQDEKQYAKSAYVCEYFLNSEVCLTVCSGQEIFSDRPEVITAVSLM